jgi:UDP-N-acetylglucosamine:LPS N-acetylglucosamine transferase
VLLVSSSGGVLLDLLALRPWWQGHDVTWVAVPAPDTEVALAGQRVHWSGELSAGTKAAVLPATWRALRLLRRERIDIVVSAGTGVAVGFFLAAKLLRVPSLWLETFNMTGPSGTAARVCSRLSSAVLVQRAALLESRPRAVLIGELY